MNEYLVEMTSYPNGEEVNDEELIYVIANKKLHTNRKIKKENIYNEGIYNDFYSTESKAATQRGIYHC